MRTAWSSFGGRNDADPIRPINPSRLDRIDERRRALSAMASLEVRPRRGPAEASDRLGSFLQAGTGTRTRTPLTSFGDSDIAPKCFAGVEWPAGLEPA